MPASVKGPLGFIVPQLLERRPKGRLSDLADQCAATSGRDSWTVEFFDSRIEIMSFATHERWQARRADRLLIWTGGAVLDIASGKGEFIVRSRSGSVGRAG